MDRQAEIALIHNIKDNVASNVTVMRYFDDMTLKTPMVSVRFKESEKPFTKFLNDQVGSATTAPYKKYALLYANDVQIRVIDTEKRLGGTNDMRTTVGGIVDTIHDLIRKEWNSLLDGYGAFVIRDGAIVFRNSSFMHRKQRFYSKRADFRIASWRTWDLVPDSGRATLVTDIEYETEMV